VGRTATVDDLAEIGHEPTFVDAAHFAGKRTFD
jgi:hypothetical protein